MHTDSRRGKRGKRGGNVVKKTRKIRPKMTLEIGAYGASKCSSEKRMNKQNMTNLMLRGGTTSTAVVLLVNIIVNKERKTETG